MNRDSRLPWTETTPDESGWRWVSATMHEQPLAVATRLLQTVRTVSKQSNTKLVLRYRTGGLASDTIEFLLIAKRTGELDQVLIGGAVSDDGTNLPKPLREGGDGSNLDSRSDTPSDASAAQTETPERTQWNIGEDDPLSERWAKRFGFRPLADLDVLVWECEGEIPSETDEIQEDSSIRLTPWREPEGLRTLVESYDGTEDCPAWDAIREPKDVLAGYRAAGNYWPAGWHLIEIGKPPPVGVVIIGRDGSRDASAMPWFELTYIGLIRSQRGRGLGEATLRLMRERLAFEARRNVASRPFLISTAVDRANRPANRLYRRLDFERIFGERVWVAD